MLRMHRTIATQVSVRRPKNSHSKCARSLARSGAAAAHRVWRATASALDAPTDTERARARTAQRDNSLWDGAD